MVGPDYEPPEADLNLTWLSVADERVNAEPLRDSEWWKAFDDPVLNALTAEAYAQNLSLQAAAVRVLQSMAERGIAVGELFPQQQELNGFFARDKFSENPTPPTRYSETWSGGFDAAWELDFWGKIRRNIESADAILDANLASYDDVMVTLVSEVAATYVSIRTLQTQIRIAENNIELQEESFRLANARFTAGATSELDVAQARSSLDQTRALLPALQVLLKQEMYQLNLLLGTPPRDLMARLGEDRDIPTAPSSIAVGIPADLLRRRPDIRVAERRAAAESANIGIAAADLYPALSISGSIGLQSESSGDFFDSDSWTGSILPGFSWPLLNYGRLKNRVRAQDAVFQEAVLAYQNTVLAAAQEVESGLVAFLGNQEQVEYLATSVESARRSLELASIRYREGSSTFTRVLDAQGDLLVVEQAHAEARSRVATSLIATHKALGGGWGVRNGMEIVPDEVRSQMEERTDWGDMLDPEYPKGNDFLFLPRHDPSKITVEPSSESEGS
ncbi:MAG: efflux transporter outer membrane subunit [Planctomycetota bacterium]|jgi:NodT family efflux transporter outer membrane factor (OMF) lipoprotein